MVYDSEYIEVSIPVLQRIRGVLSFDVYVRRSETAYTRIFPKGEAIDWSRVQNYQSKKGLQTLSVRREEYREYLLFVEQITQNLLNDPNKKITSEEVTAMLKEMVNLTMVEIVVDLNVDQNAVSHAGATVRGCIDTLGEDPKAIVDLLKQLGQHPYVVRHSISTSVFSILIAQEVDLESANTLEIIGMGAFLHDIGMSRLPFNAEEKDSLTPQEWKEVKEHPQIGKQILESIKSVSAPIRQIILQHHEQPNGQGYPNGLRGPVIYPPAKIVAVADSFCAYMAKRPFRNEGMSPLKAIEFMKEDPGKYDLQLINVLKDLLVPVKD